MLPTSVEPHFFEAFSSYNQLKRVTAYCLRFAHNTRKKKKRGGHLIIEELNIAEMTIFKIIQEEHFHSEIIRLRKGKPLNKQSKIACLNASKDRLLRVSDRIQGLIMDYNTKHSWITTQNILLSRKHYATDFIIRHVHKEYKHAGINRILYGIRERFWPIDACNNVGCIIRGCITCFRVKPPEMQYRMSNLPALKITAARSFENIGVDYCGLFYVKKNDCNWNKGLDSDICLRLSR